MACAAPWRTASALRLGVALLGIAFASPSWGAQGDLDPTFADGGIYRVVPCGTCAGLEDNEAIAITLTPSGDLVLYGQADDSASGFAFSFLEWFQVDADGVLIEEGNVADGTTGSGIGVQLDGKVLITGTASAFGGNLLARFLTDGTLDGAFGTGGIVLRDPADTIVPQPDGKILVANNDIVRYLSDGTVDGAFGTAGTVSGVGHVLALQSDGRIVAAGVGGVLRLESDGSLDATFGVGGVVTPPFFPSNVALGPGGSIVIGGSSIARYDATGTLDPSFGAGGVLAVNGDVMAIDATDGSFFTVVPGGLQRYDATGTLDAAFGIAGTASTPFAPVGMVVQADGRPVIVGLSQPPLPVPEQLSAARFLVACGDGTLDAGEECDAGAANGASTSCCELGCTLRAAAEVCRPAADVCDATETCDGATATCPADLSLPDGSECGLDACTTAMCTAGVCGPLIVTACSACESCDLIAGCIAAPQVGCRQPTVPLKSILEIKDKSPDDRDKLTWKWQKGELTPAVDFGDPTQSDDYTLCIFDESGAEPAVLMSALVPANGVCDPTKPIPCWKSTKKGFQYKDRQLTPDGVQKLDLREGLDGKAKISVGGRGGNLQLPAPPLPLPLRVQLSSTSGVCWEAEYVSAGVKRNEPGRFKGKNGTP